MADHEHPSFRRIAAGFLAALLLLLATGFWFYRDQTRALREKSERQLLSIGRLKVDQIVAWRRERLAAAAVLAESLAGAALPRQALSGGSIRLPDGVRNRLESFGRLYNYSDILLVDSQGQSFFCLSGRPNRHTGYAVGLDTALRERRPVFVNLHRESPDEQPHMGVVAPIPALAPGDQQPATAVVLVIEASQFLFPLLQTWPVPSTTAETLLVQREGDSALFLNELRHRKDTALRLRIPLDRAEIPAVKAIRGEQGIVRGVDYRGADVLAAILPVPESPWFIVAKEDAGEVFSAQRFGAVMILGLLLTTLAVVTGLWLAAWQRRQKHYYRSLYQTESLLRASVERHSVTLRSIGDAVIATDAAGRVELLNPVAEKLTGWSQEEATGRPLKEVFQIINEATGEPVLDPVAMVLREGLVVSLANHTVLISKKGKRTPIADSGAPMRDENGKITGVVLVFRDQSEERKAQRRLQEQNAFVETLLDSLPLPVFYKDRERRYLKVNRAFEAFCGKTREELAGATVFDVAPPELAAAFDSKDQELLQHPGAQMYDSLVRDANGSLREVVFHNATFTDGEGGIAGLVGAIVDNTERNRAEQFYNRLFEMATDLLCVADLNTATFLHVNQAFGRVLGYSREELLGRPFLEFVHPDDVERTRSAIQQELRQGLPLPEFENRYRCKDGGYVWLSWNARPIPGEESVFAIAHDVTEQKMVQRALQALAAAGSAGNLPAPLVLVREAAGCLDANCAFLLRLDAQQATATRVAAAFLNGEFADGLPGSLARTSVETMLSRGHGIWRSQARSQFPGDPLLAQLGTEGLWAAALRDSNGSVTGLLVVTSDRPLPDRPRAIDLLHSISARAAVELEREDAYAELNRERKFLRRVIDSVDAFIYVKDLEGRYVLANRSLAEAYGTTADALEGRLDPGFGPKPEEVAKFIEDDSRVMKLGETLVIPEEKFTYADGSVHYLTTVKSPLVEKDGSCRSLLAVAMDITARKLAEQEQGRLRAAIQQAAESILITDRDGNIQYVNPAFERLTGYGRDEVVGQNPRFLKSGEHDESFYANLWLTIRGGQTWRGRVVNRRKDGSRFTEESTISPVLDSNGEIVNYVAVNRDITEQLRMSAQVEQMQKLDTIGRLAGGIAHDFNNMLLVILGRVEEALATLSPSGTAYQALLEVRDAATRSADLTRQLLGFARRQTTSPQILNLNHSIGGMLPMLRSLMGEGVELSWRPGQEMWTVQIDPSQVAQIMTNLCANARDAVQGSGSVVIETSNVAVSQPYCEEHPGFTPGEYVLVAVSDSGCGIPKDEITKVFEPFFTTKDTGQGTGLGLATVYGIVRQNGGFINVYSEPEEGTTFKIYLPRHDGEVEAPAPPPPEEAWKSRGETILLVEDEPSILRLSKMLLERLGYRVLAAGHPSEALEIASGYYGEIDILVTDVVMPGMNGRQLSEKLLAARPKLKRLFMSGYTANVIAHHGALEPGVHFLQKPFTGQDLAAKVRGVLDA